MAKTITYNKDHFGYDDLRFKSSGTARASWSRRKSDNATTQKIYMIDAADVQFRSVAKQVEDIIDGGYDVTLKPKDMIVGAGHLDIYSGYDFRMYSDAGSTAKFTVDAADGSGVRALSNDKYSKVTKTVSDLDTSTWVGYYVPRSNPNVYIQPTHVIENTVTHSDGGSVGSTGTFTCCYYARNTSSMTHRYNNRSVGFIYDGYTTGPCYDLCALRSFIKLACDEAYVSNDDKQDVDVITWNTLIDGDAKAWGAFSEGELKVDNCGSGSTCIFGLYGRLMVKDAASPNMTSYGVALYSNYDQDSDYDDHIISEMFRIQGKMNTGWNFVGGSLTTIYQYGFDLANALYDGTAAAIRLKTGTRIILDSTAYDATNNYYLKDSGIRVKSYWLGATSSKSGTYSAVAGTDAVLICSGAWTLTLPTAAANAGLTFWIKQTSANNLTVQPSSGTIDGAASKVITTQYGAMQVVCNGTNWFILNSMGTIT